MRRTFLSLVFVAITILPRCIAAQTPPEFDGTWSGQWMPKAGVPEPTAVQLVQDGRGKLTGRFLSPITIDLTSSSYNPRTRTITLETVDQKSGTRYKILGKVEGTAINGTMDVGETSGKVLLIKWTYVIGSIK